MQGCRETYIKTPHIERSIIYPASSHSMLAHSMAQVIRDYSALAQMAVSETSNSQTLDLSRHLVDNKILEDATGLNKEAVSSFPERVPRPATEESSAIDSVAIPLVGTVFNEFPDINDFSALYDGEEGVSSCTSVTSSSPQQYLPLTPSSEYENYADFDKQQDLCRRRNSNNNELMRPVRGEYATPPSEPASLQSIISGVVQWQSDQESTSLQPFDSPIDNEWAIDDEADRYSQWGLRIYKDYSGAHGHLSDNSGPEKSSCNFTSSTYGNCEHDNALPTLKPCHEDLTSQQSRCTVQPSVAGSNWTRENMDARGIDGSASHSFTYTRASSNGICSEFGNIPMIINPAYNSALLSQINDSLGIGGSNDHHQHDNAVCSYSCSDPIAWYSEAGMPGPVPGTTAISSYYGSAGTSTLDFALSNAGANQLSACATSSIVEPSLALSYDAGVYPVEPYVNAIDPAMLDRAWYDTFYRSSLTEQPKKKRSRKRKAEAKSTPAERKRQPGKSKFDKKRALHDKKDRFDAELDGKGVRAKPSPKILLDDLHMYYYTVSDPSSSQKPMRMAKASSTTQKGKRTTGSSTSPPEKAA